MQVCITAPQLQKQLSDHHHELECVCVRLCVCVCVCMHVYICMHASMSASLLFFLLHARKCTSQHLTSAIQTTPRLGAEVSWQLGEVLWLSVPVVERSAWGGRAWGQRVEAPSPLPPPPWPWLAPYVAARLRSPGCLAVAALCPANRRNSPL